MDVGFSGMRFKMFALKRYMPALILLDTNEVGFSTNRSILPS